MHDVPGPGEIYYATTEVNDPLGTSWAPVRHRVVVVSERQFNTGGRVVAVMVTSKKFKERSRLANCVPFHAGSFGFTEDCVAQAETITLYDMAELDTKQGPIAVLDAEKMAALIRAVGVVIGAYCIPDAARPNSLRV